MPRPSSRKSSAHVRIARAYGRPPRKSSGLTPEEIHQKNIQTVLAFVDAMNPLDVPKKQKTTASTLYAEYKKYLHQRAELDKNPVFVPAEYDKCMSNVAQSYLKAKRARSNSHTTLTNVSKRVIQDAQKRIDAGYDVMHVLGSNTQRKTLLVYASRRFAEFLQDPVVVERMHHYFPKYENIAKHTTPLDGVYNTFTDLPEHEESE